jgi:mRNA-degrading endonuclease RelE of RelBE toxin-antitoxin system
MIFVETRPFSRRRAEQLTDEQFRLLQLSLLSNPQAGELIPGTGGLRKLRWATTGRGKRGGVRIIYYLAVGRDTIFLLFMYPKNEQEDLTPEQKRTLRKIVDSEPLD